MDNISTKFSGFDNLEDSNALKTMIITYSIPVGTVVSAATTTFYFGTCFEKGTIITNIVPSLLDNGAPNNIGDLVIAGSNAGAPAGTPTVALALGTITAIGVPAQPTYGGVVTGLNTAAASEFYITATPTAAGPVTITGAAKVIRFAVIYKNAH